MIFGFNNKGQAWGFDLMIGVIIFLFGIISFYLYILNAPGEGEDIIDTLTYNGGLVSDSLLSEGVPQNWNSVNVIQIGLLVDGKINQTKLENFYNLALTDYDKTKRLFNIRKEYFVNLSTQSFEVAGVPVSGIGLEPSNPRNLVKVSRIIVYKNKPTTINIEIWD